MKKIKLPLILLTLTACAKQDVVVIDEQTFNPESGVVIAKSEFIGKRYATETEGTTSDCEGGVGIGVTVESAMTDSSYIFNRSKKPCKSAEIVFDGTEDLYARAADPTIDIVFNDKYGKLPQTHNIEKTAKSATLLTDTTAGFSANADLAKKQYQEMGMLKTEYEPLEKQDALNLQQAKFEELLKENLEKNKEIALAAARAEKRKTEDKENNKLEQENSKLATNNEKTRRFVENLTENVMVKSQEIENLSDEISTLKLSKEVQANTYDEKISLLEKRIEDFAQLSLELKRQNELLALNLKQSNKIIETDLTIAEQDADNARYVAMLKAAENIEVDERLANALEESQKKSLQRKAQRLQTQADTLAYHAQADKIFTKDMQKVYQELQQNMQPAFEGKMARVVGVDINRDPTLSDVQLLLSEKDRNLDAILGEILHDVQPMVGTWKLDWKLASHNLQIKDELWNISAETTLYEFFAYIKNRVKEIHGVDLQIEEYPETRKIIITDSF